MKLKTYCTYCKEDFTIKSNASTRIDLEMEKGEKFNVGCEKCKKINEVHVNDVKAINNPIISIVGVVISIILTVLFWNVLGFFASLTLSIPLIIWNQQKSTLKAFNSYWI